MRDHYGFVLDRGDASESESEESSPADGSQPSMNTAFIDVLKEDLYDAIFDASEGVSSADAANEALSTAPRSMQPFAAAATMEFKCSAFGKTYDMPCSLNPGLYINEIGRVNLPLLESDVSTIIGLATQKSSSDAPDTPDVSQRSGPFMLDASRFIFKNPSWSTYLKHVVVPQALLKLGFDRENVVESIAARPSKLTLYGSGASSVPPNASEVQSEHFGTLNIFLPSQNIGALYYTKRQNREFEFQTDRADCEWKSHWTIACKEAEKPAIAVTEGFQLVMTYDLVHDSKDGDTTPGKRGLDNVRRVKEVLNRWQQQLQTTRRETPSMLAHRLADHRTDEELLFDNLKGNDRYEARVLRQACSESNFHICLANLHRTAEESYYEDEHPHNMYELTKVIYSYSDGHEDEIGSSVAFDLECMLEPEDQIYEKDRDPDSEEGGGDEWSENDEGRTLHFEDTVSYSPFD